MRRGNLGAAHAAAIATMSTLQRVGLTAVALALIAVMGWLGWWQVSVYDDHQHDDAAQAQREQPVPLTDLLGPDDPLLAADVGRPVIANGEYLADEQFTASGLEGLPDGASAVVTPLRTATGSSVLVVRGAAEAGQDLPPPAGAVTVVGYLEPSMADGTAIDADGTATGLHIPSLVSGISTDLYGGYLVLSESKPADVGLAPVPPPEGEPSPWAGIRNLAYGIQWWAFAGFVVFMWWRIWREDAARTAQQAQEAPPG